MIMKPVSEAFDSNIVCTSDLDYLTNVYGNAWGLNNDIGKIKSILVRRPGKEITASINEESATFHKEYGAWINNNFEGYWTSPDGSLPRLDLMQEQHDHLVSILKEHGAEIVYLEENEQYSKSINVRDIMNVVPGGGIINRLAPKMRQGEEKALLKTISTIDFPIVGAITGKGVFEGGSFGFITEKLAFAGHSKRGNTAGINQLKNILSNFDIDLLTIPLVGHSLHTDSAFLMIDPHIALINSSRLPYWFLEKLDELKIKTIELPRDEFWGINSLVIERGTIIVTSTAVRTIERLEQHGFKVIPIDYSEMQKSGGGIHCSTLPLQRENI